MSSAPDHAELADRLAQTHTVGRYVLHRQIARGGMATIHIARLMGDEGFSRIVAAKRLHPEFAEDSEFVAMFLDEARIASKIHHRNVVPVLDVVTTQDEVLLVQEFVHGAPLHWLLNKAHHRKERVPIEIAVSIASQVLAGLHAAHEMVDEMGVALHVVHRDVSPQNVMVATDGTARLLDFGVAKASMAAHVTREGMYKGKLAYSAPEHLRGRATKQSDLYALAVVLWELIVGHRMHGAQSETELVATIMNGHLPRLTDTLAPEREWQSIGDDAWRMLEAVDRVVQRGLSIDLADRWETAAQMEEALCHAVTPASSNAVATWVKDVGKEYLEKHERLIAAEEASWRRTGGAAVRTVRLPTSANIGLDSLSRRPLPSAPEPPRSRTVIALLGAMVAVVVICIVMVLESPSAESRAPEPAPPVEAVQPLVPSAAVVQAPAPPALAPPALAPPALAPIAVAPPALAPIAKTVEPRVVVTRKAVAPVRPAPRAPRVETRPPPPPPSAPPSAPVAENKTDCTPPYYFEGSKKIFKAACL